MPTPHVLLLRGINVGGNHKLPMRDLIDLVEAAGATRVRTYIQSGNVVCDVAAENLLDLQNTVAASIRSKFGFPSPVVARSKAEWADMIAAAPYTDNDAALYVAFLADFPSSARVAALQPDRSPGDRFEVRGRDIYLSLVKGVAGTRLTNAWMDSALATVSTARNWRTVLALAEMLAA